ncbi:TSUP family transporter [Humidisolicoccus flavus]|uniref:TSUP family transporter n=1 Tax=Humidisolicoccus flavus TaxID=3111414 RepID=UPI00324490EB
MTFVFALGVALFGAIVQRVTGLGFALVATPPLVLLFGPNDGVRIVVLLGIVASGIMAVTMRRDIQWKRTWGLIWPALLVSPLAALVAHVSPAVVLLYVVGVAAVLSLVAPKIPKLSMVFSGRGGSVVTGASAGFLHVTSGLSGPPLVAHAAGTKWAQVQFVASVQIVFLAFHVLTLGWRGLPSTSTSSAVELVALAAVVALGILLGGLIARRVRVEVARKAMFAVAWIGAIVVLIRATVELVDRLAS